MIIPFFLSHAGCPHQCVFCDQKRITGSSAAPPSAIPHVIAAFLSGSPSARTEDPAGAGAGAGAFRADEHEVAFYGGTFTALPEQEQRSYLAQVQPFIASGVIAGIRISTRPDALPPGTITMLEQHHVRMVELGAQSMDDAVLRRAGRGHSTDDTIRAVRLLRERGIGVGLQIMLGLPGDSESGFLETVRKVVDLRPDVVRMYPALVLNGTGLEDLFRTAQYAPLGLEEAVSLCGRALLRFRAARIPVIRIGLQSSGELEQPGTIVAGPYHPAFRQLVESHLFLHAFREALAKRPDAADSASFLVHRADLTAAIGTGRANILRLTEEFGLHKLNILQDDAVERGSFRYLHAGERGGVGHLASGKHL